MALHDHAGHSVLAGVPPKSIEGPNQPINGASSVLTISGVENSPTCSPNTAQHKHNDHTSPDRRSLDAALFSGRTSGGRGWASP